MYRFRMFPVCSVDDFIIVVYCVLFSSWWYTIKNPKTRL